MHPPTTWLLDANTVSYLFQAEAETALEAAAAQGIALAVVDQVCTELRRTDPGKHPWARRYRAWTWPPAVTRLDPLFGDAADTCYRRLLHRYCAQPATVSQRGLGELLSIAYAVVDPALVFVAHDSNALWRAAHEVRPLVRVASALAFFDHLRQRGALDATQHTRLGENKSLKDHLPSWWGH